MAGRSYELQTEPLRIIDRVVDGVNFQFAAIARSGIHLADRQGPAEAGVCLLAQRFKSPQGEVDLIMRRRDVTAFIEVKARGSRDRGVEAVTITQSRRISAAARFWMARDRISNRNFCRFDIVVVSPYLLPHHIENAFPGDG